ncbi:MAG TPA: hypothetical protein VLB09_07245 [Nitrospiria bacterium]|nr:hypothetical protein [Nitrospiria bacterium]
MFGLLSVFIYLTMATNPQKVKYQKTPPGESAQIPEGPRKWDRIYAEFHDADGLQKTMEIKNEKGYFNEADRAAFLEKSRTEKPYGNAEVRVIEDSIDLVFGIYLTEEAP